jgi:hypothetical protein
MESNLNHFFFSPLPSRYAAIERKKGIGGLVFVQKDVKWQGKFGLILPGGRGLDDLGYSSIDTNVQKRHKGSRSVVIITWKKIFCQCRVSKSVFIPQGGFSWLKGISRKAERFEKSGSR